VQVGKQAQPGERERWKREREGSETLPYCVSDPQLMEAHQWRPEIKIWSSKGHIPNEG